jgi:hypothetical protein
MGEGAVWEVYGICFHELRKVLFYSVSKILNYDHFVCV